MSWTTIKAHIKGAWRSWTLWFAGALAALPEVLPMVRDSWPDFAPFIPAALQSHVMQLIALGITLLRIKTRTSLAGKGAQTT